MVAPLSTMKLSDSLFDMFGPAWTQQDPGYPAKIFGIKRR